MRRIFLFSAIFILLILGGGFFYFLWVFSKPAAALLVNSSETAAIVTINEKIVGTTPYLNEGLREGEIDLKLTSEIKIASEGAKENKKVYKSSWSRKIKLTAGTQTVVNYQFAPAEPFSNSTILYLEKGSGIIVSSDPSQAEVSLDGNLVSLTPYNSQISVGEHKLKISKDGFIPKEIVVNVPTNFKLNVDVSLMLDPFSSVAEIEASGKFKLLDLSTSEPKLISDTTSWAESIWFLQQKNQKENLYLLLDWKGATSSATKTNPDEKKISQDGLRIGYLGEKGKPVSDEALAVWQSLINTQTKNKIEIGETPTGTLNVRETPSFEATILGIVKPGETFEFLEEKEGWFEIKFQDSKGWISSQYAKKI